MRYLTFFNQRIEIDFYSIEHPFLHAVDISPMHKIDTITQHDFNVQVDLGNDLLLAATVFNITDEDPPLARLDYSYDPFTGNPFGRTYKIGLTKDF